MPRNPENCLLSKRKFAITNNLCVRLFFEHEIKKLIFPPRKFTSFELVSAVQLIHTTVTAPKLWKNFRIRSNCCLDLKSMACWDFKLANFNSIGKGFVHSTALEFDTIYPEIIWGRFWIRYLDDIDEALFFSKSIVLLCLVYYFSLTFLNWRVMKGLKSIVGNLIDLLGLTVKEIWLKCIFFSRFLNFNAILFEFLNFNGFFWIF